MALFKRIIKIVLTLIALLILLIFVLLLPDGYAEFKFTRQLKSSLPVKTELIKAESAAYRLQGTGDGTEFLSVALVKSDLTKAQLETYYSCYYFDFAKPYARHLDDPDGTLIDYKVHIQIEKVRRLPIETEFSADCRDILFFDDIQITDFKNVYFIAIYDETYHC
ncbi:MAG: hypothetical protein RSA97_08980 [Oscillospiraceae bacterium]